MFEPAKIDTEHHGIGLLSLLKEEFSVTAMAFFAPVVGTWLALRQLKKRTVAEPAQHFRIELERGDDRDHRRLADARKLHDTLV